MSSPPESDAPGHPEGGAPAVPEKGFGAEAKLSYGSYLRVPELLQLQVLESDPPHPDELQFIIIHQTYELWFKLVLFELEHARAALFESRLDDADHHLARVRAIEKVLAGQIHVLETMTPAGFLGFRDRLMPASGFQSVQFREVEILSGLRDPRYVEFLERENVPEVADAVRRRLGEPSLRDAMHAMLAAQGFDIGWDPDARTWDEGQLAAALLAIHRTLAPRPVYRVLDALVEHDQLVALWRAHHVSMVERMIGTRPGTGGSTGAAYLRSTLPYRFFPELWAVRGDLQPPGGAY